LCCQSPLTSKSFTDSTKQQQVLFHLGANFCTILRYVEIWDIASRKSKCKLHICARVLLDRVFVVDCSRHTSCMLLRLVRYMSGLLRRRAKICATQTINESGCIGYKQ
jgi:hypothetical protein